MVIDYNIDSIVSEGCFYYCSCFVVPCSFNFICDLKVYLILDEFILAGELQETSKKVCIVLMLSYC